VSIAFLVLDSAMPPGQTTTSEVRVDIRRFEHTNGQYGGADKTVAADAVKESQNDECGAKGVRVKGEKVGISCLMDSR
jgi:hypothetical protein